MRALPLPRQQHARWHTATAPTTATSWTICCRRCGRATRRRGEDGVVRLAGVDVRELAGEFGTPLFVVDEDDFRSRCREHARAFGDPALVHYAAKAFLSVQIARWVAEEGLSLDVCSGGELAIALRAEFPPERITLHGNNKSVDELTAAVEAGRRRGGARLVLRDRAARPDRPRPRRRAAGAGARDGRRRGTHPRVHRDRARGPEVRLLAGRRRGGGGGAAGAARAGAAADRPAQPHRLADLRRQRVRAVRAPRDRAARRAAQGTRRRRAWPRCPPWTSAAASASPTRPRTTRRRPAGSPSSCAPSWPRSASTPGSALPKIAVEPGRAIVGPGTVTLYEVGTTKDVELGPRVVAPVRQRGRRDERQHPHRAVRRAVRLPAGVAVERRGGARHGGRRCPGWSASTASPATSSCGTAGCRRTSRRAT